MLEAASRRLGVHLDGLGLIEGLGEIADLRVFRAPRRASSGAYCRGARAFERQWSEASMVLTRLSRGRFAGGSGRVGSTSHGDLAFLRDLRSTSTRDRAGRVAAVAGGFVFRFFGILVGDDIDHAANVSRGEIESVHAAPGDRTGDQKGVGGIARATSAAHIGLSGHLCVRRRNAGSAGPYWLSARVQQSTCSNLHRRGTVQACATTRLPSAILNALCFRARAPAKALRRRVRASFVERFWPFSRASASSCARHGIVATPPSATCASRTVPSCTSSAIAADATPNSYD